jgi:hypothetical protein
MHIHLGVLHAVGVFLTVVVVGFFWRLIAGWNAGNSVGQAMSFIY